MKAIRIKKLNKMINITPDLICFLLPWRIEKRNLGYDGCDNKYKQLVFNFFVSYSKKLEDWSTAINSTISIIHLYKEKTNNNIIRDNDNFSQLAIKGIVDGIRLARIVNDDSGIRLDLFFSSHFSNIDGTLIIIKRRNNYGRKIII